MSQFLHFTVGVEFNGRLSAEQLTKIGEEIAESLQRHADTVAVERKFDAVAPKVKRRVVPRKEMPETRNHNNWHLHDNDGACTPCVRLYEFQHDNTL